MNEKLKTVLSAVGNALVWGFILALFLITGVQCWMDDKFVKGFSLVFGGFAILLILINIQFVPLYHKSEVNRNE